MCKIKNYITTHNLLNQNDTIIIGLSGGPDSVFLLHMLVALRAEYNLTLIAAHLNHEWRKEADEEEALCAQIAQQHAIPFFSAKISQLKHTIKQSGSKEEYARKIRRFFLEKVLHERHAQHIALGHHAQDQQETFFIRLIRGTSLTGLTSMKPKHGLYIRPLLETNKNDILAWLTTHNISYAIDSSNESSDFLRNRIRSSVLPALHECDKRFDANFLSTLQHLQEDDEYLMRITHQLFDTITTVINNNRSIDLKKFFAADKALYYRLIIHWFITEKVPFQPTQTFLDEIIRFLESPRGGTHTLHASWRIVKKQQHARIEHIIKSHT